jgi:transcription initiation factor TFIID TATA-box-binding protein
LSINSNVCILNENLRIASVIYSLTISEKIDINKIVSIYNCVKIYQNNRLSFKDEISNSTICISQNGYIRVMGINSKEKAINTLDRVLKNLSFNEIISNKYVIIKKGIENIVVTGKINGPINLEDIAMRLGNLIYEPEQFPGIIYRPGEKSRILLFASGKLVIVGTKTIEEINSEYLKIKEKLSQG